MLTERELWAVRGAANDTCVAGADEDCYRANPAQCSESTNPIHCGWFQRESEQGLAGYYYKCHSPSEGRNCEIYSDAEICRIVYLCQWITDEQTGYGACFVRDPPNNIFQQDSQYPYYAIGGDPCP